MMKIAFPTDDGQTISRHFGQARFFRVITTEESHVVLSEQREKDWHQHGQSHEGAPGADAHPGPAMLQTISDCQVLISGGMGEPVFARAQTMGIIVILTGEQDIEKALEGYLHGGLVTDKRRIHKPNG